MFRDSTEQQEDSDLWGSPDELRKEVGMQMLGEYMIR